MGEVVGRLGTPRRVPNSANGHKKLPTAVSLRMGRQAPLGGREARLEDGVRVGQWRRGGGGSRAESQAGGVHPWRKLQFILCEERPVLKW